MKKILFAVTALSVAILSSCGNTATEASSSSNNVDVPDHSKELGRTFAMLGFEYEHDYSITYDWGHLFVA